VTAVDLVPMAIDLGRAHGEAAGVRVTWVVGDALTPPDLNGPFEFFFDRGCYHVVRRDGVEGYLRTLDRYLKPGGLALVLAGNAREKMDPGPPVVEEADIRAELGRSFDVLWLKEFRFDQPEGGGPRPLGWSCFLRKRTASGK
jgi:SAM-dependent methyltransferase